jgi:hypothetical protein
MRSNDVVWGAYNINVVEWTFLQEVIARLMNYDENVFLQNKMIVPGFYYHNAGSFHYYANMEERVDNILNAPFFDIYRHGIQSTPIDVKTFSTFSYDMQMAASLLSELIGTSSFGGVTPVFDRTVFGSRYIYGMFLMCVAYIHIEQGRFDAAADVIIDPARYIAEDLRVAALEYFNRRLKKEKDFENNELYVSFIKRARDRYKNMEEVMNFITGDWYAKYRLDI